ncbi:MAG: MFS transporter, partial [bacterium]
GKIAQAWSLKKMMTLIVYGWVVSLLLFIMTDSMTVVWIIGSLVGILLGGLWTVSRPLLAELVPREELGRFFGLFSLSGRAAAVIGPLVWTVIVYLFNPERSLGKFAINLLDIETVNYEKLPYKMGVVSLVIMMIIGLVIFRKVPHTRINSDG